MITLRHVLCPVDLSEPSRRALQHAAGLAAWYEASLDVLYVDTTLAMEGLTEFGDFAIARTAALDVKPSTRVVDEVRAFVDRAACKTPVEVVVERSTHVEGAILERARTLPADLIVMGSHGRSGVQRLLLGSVTEHVLRAASCPVLVVPPHDVVSTSAVSFKKIVCAVDFSESSLTAVTWAVSLAQEADAALSLLHVIEVPPELHASGVVTSREIDELHAALEADTLERLRALVPVNATDYCSVETATASGAAGHAILAFSKQQGADLIVMGAQGQRAIERVVFGSKTREVVCGATCPVLTVRP